MEHRFFGYGSLVNAATHSYVDCRPATLIGWRRVWVHSVLRPVAYLSAERADTEIDGLAALVPDGDWQALDAREAAYDKHPVDAICQTTDATLAAQVYVVPPRHAAAPDQRHPILLSYLDVVIQGYMRVFGEAGAARFFETTAGWDSPVLDDRAAPRYPRHQALSDAERRFVDARLAQTSATVIQQTEEAPLSSP